MDKNEEDRFAKLQKAVKLNRLNQNSFKILKTAIKENAIQEGEFDEMIKQLIKKGLINKEKAASMKEAHELKQEVISVDSFSVEEYKASK